MNMSASFETLEERAEHIRELRMLRGHSDDTRAISFSPDGHLLASGSRDNTVRLWEVETGRHIRTLEGHTSIVNDVGFSPDGHLLASGSRDNTVRLWEVETGRQVRRLERRTGQVHGVSFSPDGHLLASGSSDNTVRLWEVETGRQVRTLEGHRDAVEGLRFSPDGHLLASGSYDKTIRLWVVETGRQVRTLEEHSSYVWCVSFSPDGHLLASGSNDNTVRLWDVETGRHIRTLVNHISAGWISGMSFSPDGRLLASRGTGNTVRLWDVSSLDVGPKDHVRRNAVRIAPAREILRPLQAHLRTLPLSHTIPPTPSRPAAWLRSTNAVGMHPPLCIAQDLGTLLTQPRDRLRMGKPEHLPDDVDTTAYANFLMEMAKQPSIREVSRWDMSDAVTGVITARLLAGVKFPEQYAIPGGTGVVRFARQLGMRLDSAEPAKLWREIDPAQRPDMSKLLPPQAIAQIEANLRQLDASELRFMNQYGPRFSGAPDPRELLDLFNLLQLPSACRLALTQVLRLLPRVSETVSMGGVQTYAMGGYEGITRKGNLDSLVPTELAYPRDVFLHRLLDREALYYGRESERERQRELAYIITQVGLEMKGDGELLARALTLVLGQTMHRRGYAVQQSFVGSEWTRPSGLMRPVDVHRVLYYQDKGWLHPGEMLESVLGQVRSWGDEYRNMQLFWVVSEHWDADYCRDHTELYASLKRRAGQQVWFIHVGGDSSPAGASTGNGNPVTCEYFHRYQVLNTDMLWQG